MKLDLLTNATMVSDAIRLVSNYENGKSESTDSDNSDNIIIESAENEDTI
jgi:hypothetical protein